MADGAKSGDMLDRLSESVAAKFAMRIVLPLVTLALIPLIAAQWSGMRADITSLNAKVEQITALEREVSNLNTRYDAGFAWRLTELERRFNAMEARAERREQQHRPTPQP